MSLDAIGCRPKSPIGKEFQSIPRWGAFAALAIGIAPDIASRCKSWHHSEGDGLTAEDSETLADRLETRLARGDLRPLWGNI
jgi:hypothetical protein